LISGVLLALCAAQPAQAAGFMAINPAEMKARVVTIESNSIGETKVASVQSSDLSRFKKLDRNLLASKYRFRRSDEKPVVKARVASSRVPKSEADAILDLFDEGARGAASASVEGHQWPVASNVDQRLTSGFGRRADPFTGKPAFHQGIDIAAQTGTAVRASADGIVSDVGSHGRLGNYVRIEHGGEVETQYGHLSSQTVRKGQRVRQGQTIGKIGSTGRSTGPHLDYSIRIDGQEINPLNVVAKPARIGTTYANNLRR
jgi:murein DD-endopeptidase MepM/ murein hydrolase activator NlpD